MDKAAFAAWLRKQIVEDYRRFQEAHPDETPYAYALLGGQPGAPFLSSVIATEEGLRRVAIEYQRLGYRWQGIDETRPATLEELMIYLRWANPDDGWHFTNLHEHELLQKKLTALIDEGALGHEGELFEEFCIEVLASLQSLPAWRRNMVPNQFVVGLTYGCDPQDFLRTATRANPYPLVQRLWAETMRANELRLSAR